MKNRERQRENRRQGKNIVCPHHRCASNKEGFCRALRTSDFGNKTCPFFKTAEQNEKEKKGRHGSIDRIGSSGSHRYLLRWKERRCR